MAKKTTAVKTATPAEPIKAEKNATPLEPNKAKLPLTKTNLMLILAGVVVVIIGFMMMAGGGSADVNQFDASEIFSFRRITLAPIVVVSGFAFVIYAIMRRPRS